MSTPENSATLDDSATRGQSEETKPPVDWEKRFKDTQADYTRKSQEVAKLRAELEAAREVPKISAEVQAELDELKYRDPDAWRAKLGQIEAEGRKLYDQKLAAITGELTVLEQRKFELDDFLMAHPGFHIDDDVIANDIPRRITNKLEKGEITWGTFLQEAHDYLATPKVIGNNQVPAKPNLDKMGGGSTPSASATEADILTSYKNEVY
jgi:hypothetical protein